jgi:hypothetical protein
MAMFRLIINKAFKTTIGNVENLHDGQSGTNGTKEKLQEAPESCIKES